MDALDITWRSTVMLIAITPMLTSAVMLWFWDVEQAACRYLAVFLLLFCVNLTPQIIGFSGFYQAFPWLTFAPFNFELAFGPLLLLHIKSLTKEPINLQQWLWLLPAVIFFFYYMIIFLTFPDYRDKWAFNDAFHQPYINPIGTILAIAINISCVWMSWIKVNGYRLLLLNSQSDLDGFDPIWLRQFIFAIVIVLTLWVGFEIYHIVISEITYPTQLPFHLAFSLILSWLGLKAITSIRMVYPTITSVDEGLRYEQDQSTLEELFMKIEMGNQEQEWFKQQRITISDIARKLHTNESYVSRSINVFAKQNFNQYINNARVQYAIKKIKEGSVRNLLDLAMESGFSSKASFNRCFKTITNKTPSTYSKYRSIDV